MSLPQVFSDTAEAGRGYRCDFIQILFELLIDSSAISDVACRYLLRNASFCAGVDHGRITDAEFLITNFKLIIRCM